MASKPTLLSNLGFWESPTGAHDQSPLGFMEAVVLRKRTKLEPLRSTRSCNPLNVLLLLFPTAARLALQDFMFPIHTDYL